MDPFPRPGRRRTRALWLLFIATCVGCAPPAAVGRTGLVLGGGRPLLASTDDAGYAPDEPRPRDAPDDLARRRREAECQLVIAQVWRVLAPVRAVGAEVEFVFWTENGALTLSSWRLSKRGGAPGNDVEDAAFARSMSGLCVFVGNGTRFLRVAERRERDGWVTRNLSFEADASARPPEAKTLPVDLSEIPAGTFAALEKLGREQWWPLLRAPSAGTASLELTLRLDDERVVEASVAGYRSTGGGGEARAPPGFVTELAGALVGFTQGVGPRTVRAVLEARREDGEAAPRWRVVSAGTVRTAREEPRESFTVAEDYRRLSEETLRAWREQVRDAAILVLGWETREIAAWVVGGWVARGMGASLEVVSGLLGRMLGTGSREAMLWFESLFVRLPEVEREAFVRLWVKAEREGIRSLSAAERAELQTALRRLEQLVGAPLDDHGKSELRILAGRRFWRDLARKDLALLKQMKAEDAEYEVHHRMGLEYAHLFGELDVNGLSNLVAVEFKVHVSIGKIWTAFRATARSPSRAEVKEVMAVVDRHYGRWYNVLYDRVREQAELAAAERAAMVDLQRVTALTRGR